MAVVGTELLNKFLHRNEAEKLFHPWWTTVKDFVLYGIILLGKKNRLEHLYASKLLVFNPKFAIRSIAQKSFSRFRVSCYAHNYVY